MSTPSLSAAPEVSAAMQPFLQGFGWGNPSSTHVFGEQAKRAVEYARRQVADLIGCGEDEVRWAQSEMPTIAEGLVVVQ
jgi:cysteine sulfinate desulfinase/cysteine desulfurase-like protein